MSLLCGKEPLILQNLPFLFHARKKESYGFQIMWGWIDFCVNYRFNFNVQCFLGYLKLGKQIRDSSILLLKEVQNRLISAVSSFLWAIGSELAWKIYWTKLKWSLNLKLGEWIWKEIFTPLKTHYIVSGKCFVYYCHEYRIYSPCMALLYLNLLYFLFLSTIIDLIHRIHLSQIFMEGTSISNS